MERVRKGMRVTVAMGVIYCICVGSILLLFAHPLIGIFSKDPTVIEFGVRAMLYFCPFYFLLAILKLMTGRMLNPSILIYAANPAMASAP